MHKKIKIILQLIILIIVAGLVVYFFVFTQNTSPTDNQDDLSKFWEMKVNNELPAEALEKFENRHTEAVASLKINPDSFSAWVALGTAKKALGDIQGALDVWLYLNQIRPQNSTSFRNAGEIYMEDLEDYQKAEEMFYTAKDNDPTREAIYLQIAWLYRFRDKDKANLVESVILEGLEQVPDSSELTVYLADWYEETGKLDKAVIYYQKALELMPDNQAIQEKLQEVQS